MHELLGFWVNSRLLGVICLEFQKSLDEMSRVRLRGVPH